MFVLNSVTLVYIQIISTDLVRLSCQQKFVINLLLVKSFHYFSFAALRPILEKIAYSPKACRPFYNQLHVQRGVHSTPLAHVARNRLTSALPSFRFYSEEQTRECQRSTCTGKTQ